VLKYYRLSPEYYLDNRRIYQYGLCESHVTGNRIFGHMRNVHNRISISGVDSLICPYFDILFPVHLGRGQDNVKSQQVMVGSSSWPL